jgi:hypothetical protein
VGTKSWYLSKTLWAGIIAVLVAAYNAYRLNLGPHLPEIPEWVFALLASLGIWGRLTTTTTLTK